MSLLTEAAMARVALLGFLFLFLLPDVASAERRGGFRYFRSGGSQDYQQNGPVGVSRNGQYGSYFQGSRGGTANAYQNNYRVETQYETQSPYRNSNGALVESGGGQRVRVHHGDPRVEADINAKENRRWNYQNKFVDSTRRYQESTVWNRGFQERVAAEGGDPELLDMARKHQEITEGIQQGMREINRLLNKELDK